MLVERAVAMEGVEKALVVLPRRRTRRAADFNMAVLVRALCVVTDVL